MEEDIQNHSPTVMFRGTPCTFAFLPQETHTEYTSKYRKTTISSTILISKGFKGALENRALPSFHWSHLKYRLQSL